MVRRTEAGISMVVVRTVVGVGLIGVPSVLGSGCEGSSKCDCETCESTGGTSASAGSANAESPEGGEATRPDGTGGQPSVGGASSSTEGGESGGATSTASGGSEHLDGTGGATSTSSGGHSWSPGGTGGGSTGGGDTGVSAGGSGTAERGGAGQSGVGSPATDGSATIDQALIGDECSDTLAVVCVAGMQRERAQCAASSGRWELYDACPDGTACAGPEASCTQTIVGCTEYTVDERYCAGDYELRQCDRYAESALVRFCEGHCIGGRCEDGPVPCAAAATPSTIDCACGCAAAGSQCEPSLNACDAASTFADLPKPVRFISPATFDEIDVGECEFAETGTFAWYLGRTTGLVRAMVSEGSSLKFEYASLPCRAVGDRNCVVALEPQFLLLNVPLGSELPVTVVVDEVDSADACP